MPTPQTPLINFNLSELGKQTVVDVKLTGKASDAMVPAAEPITFDLRSAVPERVASVGGQDIRFPGTMSDGEIQQASGEVYGKSADLQDGGLQGLIQRTVPQVAIGAAKGLGELPLFLAKAIHTVPGVSQLIDDYYGIPGLSQSAVQQAEESLEPRNTAQSVGKFVEQAAETILPGRAITRAGTALAAKASPVLSPMVGRTAAQLAPRALVEATAGAGMATLQGGDAGTAAVLSAAMPVVGGLVRRGGAVMAPGAQLNRAEQEAVDFARTRDIPIDAATATGRPIVQRWQKMAGDNLGGSGIAESFKRAQEQALERVGAELADATNAGGRAVDAVGAGEGVRGSLASLRDRFIGEADTAYERLRAIESAKHLAVDLRPVKSTMVKQYQELLRESQVAPLMGQKAEALRVLDRLMRGPDMETLSVADAALSGLKSFTRTNGALKTPGQGVIAGAVSQLDAMVRKAATDAGPDAIGALNAGRAATIAKYKVDELLETLSDEPRKVFEHLTRQKDGAIETLRLVKQHSPQELPKIGRAFLEELMGKAAGEGGFQHADALWNQWRNLGAETKRLLFPRLTPDLDRFFFMSKMIARNPNPSGTATQLTSRWGVTAIAGLAPNWAIAKLMYTPAGVRLMTKAIQAGGPTNELSAALGRIVAVQGSKVGGGQ